MAIRHEFPPYGSAVQGGHSDGLVYRTAFRGSSLEATLAMVRAFLDEEGYEDVPMPRDGATMLAFLRPEDGRHPHLFEQPDYAHDPVRILFAKRDRLRRKLVVELYNEAAPDHLLRFHRRQCREREERIRRATETGALEQWGSLMKA